MALTPEHVATIAHLARLEVRDEDVSGYCDRLSRILEFVAQLEAVDTSAVEPMAHAERMSQRLREDTAVPVSERDLFQQNAPATDGGLYLVPKVIE
ncbi:MAG: Asp-tRNA(Asn)/Glu-tRNA(Gln) amidotransferase subunit GatC [Xanthomonadaceae bacterium]|nr:Asp-tRNA(Asn)/Glu-tRNA(Gln) amidotransferase subunit GatC [Xanthomonadaceae bacterium]